MVDVKVCTKCGSSISQQEIIEGKAKLVDGKLACGSCAAQMAAAAAAARAQAATHKPISLPGIGPEATGPLSRVAGQAEAPAEAPLEIQAFGVGITHGRKAVQFQRQPHVTGSGAMRVRTFDCKLTRAALELMDEQINAWLDETGYEVKFVTTTIGDLQGKTTEQHLIVNIWY